MQHSKLPEIICVNLIPVDIHLNNKENAKTNN